MKYDSTEDVKMHIKHIRKFIDEISSDLIGRGRVHDASKLREPEKSLLDEFEPNPSIVYMSQEYVELMERHKELRAIHVSQNSHHPEYYPNGINGMSLLDLLEMLADWKAATLRNSGGNIYWSLENNKEGMSEQLYEIFKNTIEELGW